MTWTCVFTTCAPSNMFSAARARFLELSSLRNIYTLREDRCKFAVCSPLPFI